MSFSEAIKPYADKNGLVHPTTTHSSQNGVLYTAYSLALKAYLGELTQTDYEEFQGAINAVAKRHGLICRVPGPEWGYQEGPDDYIGAICGAQITSNGWCVTSRIYAYGFDNKLEVGPFRFRFFYNTDAPGGQLNSSGEKNWPAWLGRFPIFRVLVSWGVGFYRTRLERLIFVTDCLWVAYFAKQTDTDPLMMCLMKLQAFGSDKLKTRVAKILKYRKISFKKAFALYFGESHPLATFCPITLWE